MALLIRRQLVAITIGSERTRAMCVISARSIRCDRQRLQSRSVIREGRIEVLNANGDALASAGEQLRIMGSGSIERTTISPDDALWQWAAQAAPLFEVDDQTLAAFLDWVARETGRTIVYATTQAQRTAEAVRLRGSIAGLDPDAALAAVLSTTELRRSQTKDEFIGVALATTIDRESADRPTRYRRAA